MAPHIQSKVKICKYRGFDLIISFRLPPSALNLSVNILVLEEKTINSEATAAFENKKNIMLKKLTPGKCPALMQLTRYNDEKPSDSA